MNNSNSEEISKHVLKTGTSIVGIVCKDGIVMAGDRRATLGNLVGSKKEAKLRNINDYLVMAWCGSASDAQLSVKVVAAELKLKELKTRERPSVKESANLVGSALFRNIRTPSMVPSIVGHLVGGFNEDGTTELFTVEPAGGVYPVRDYDANFGSGMPYILGLLERQYRKDITVKEAVELAKEAIKAAMERDTASGNGLDVYTITKDGIQHAVSEEIIPQFNKN
jgi:proteasome beta subunit